MGKSTISMAIFNSFLYVYQRVTTASIWLGPIDGTFSTGRADRHGRITNDRPYPLVNIQKAIENGHRNSGFTH